MGFLVGAMNIMHNYLNDVNDHGAKYVHRFDPYYLYCALKNPDDLDCIGKNCDCGAYIHEALDQVQKYGAKKSGLSPGLDCGNQLSKTNLREMSYFTEAYTIDDYYTLCDYEKIDGKWEVLFDLDDFRWAIANAYPIVTGIDVEEGFDDVTGALAMYSAPEGAEEGHAVTIVGYDDNYMGGSFQFLNSYGSDWGDNGYFWMTYDDYIKSSSTAYILGNDEWDKWYLDEPIDAQSFYRGYSDDDETFWEGSISPEGYFHGQGLETTTRHNGIGSYANGYRMVGG